VPVDQEQAKVACIAWPQYDKFQHPPDVNYGDCFSYALANTHGASLLFKGNDFHQKNLSVNERALHTRQALPNAFQQRTYRKWIRHA
jgi:uncharacterized protein with PIN domain